MATKQKTPAGKVPFDYLMWLKGTRNVALAKATGIDDSMISKYRKGLRPNTDHAEKITKALDLSLEDLGWSNG